MWFQPFLYIIYAYMVTFISLIQIQNIEIYILCTANQPKNTELIFAHIAQPYFKETLIW